MFTPRRLTLIGLLAYGLFLLLQLPASQLLARIAPPTGWSLDAPHGSVWHGGVDRFGHQGRALGRLQWSVRPWALLLGELRADWHWEGPYGTARGEARYGLIGRQLSIHDLHTDLAMALVSDLGWSPFPLQGRLAATLARVDLDAGFPALQGKAHWQQAGVKVGDEALSFGRVDLQAEPRKDHTRLALSSVPGDVAVQGEIRLQPAARVGLELQLEPQTARGRELLKLMQSLGRPLADGGVAIRYQGRLP